MSDTEEFLEASLTKQVAILTLRRQTEREIAAQLNVKRHEVEKIKKSEEFSKTLVELAEEKTAVLLNQWKRGLETLYSDAWDAFKHNLKEKKSMEAVKEYLTMIGWKTKQGGEPGDGPVINLIVPGPAEAKELPDIVVKSNE